jgi:hypothetical protein
MQPEDIFTSSQLINAPYQRVWDAITRPLYYPTLYPNRFSSVVQTDDNSFAGLGPRGESFTLNPRLNIDFGVVDMQVVSPAGSVEMWRGRLLRLKSGGCLLTQMFERWEHLDMAGWQQHTARIEADLAHASALLEDESFVLE